MYNLEAAGGTIENIAAVGGLEGSRFMSDDRPGAPAATLLFVDIFATDDTSWPVSRSFYLSGKLTPSYIFRNNTAV